MSSHILHLMAKGDREKRIAAETFFLLEGVHSGESETFPTVNDFLGAEVQRCQEAHESLQQAWKAVTSQMEAAKGTQEFLDQTLPTVLAQKHSLQNFWDDQILREKFQLTSILDDLQGDSSKENDVGVGDDTNRSTASLRITLRRSTDSYHGHTSTGASSSSSSHNTAVGSDEYAPLRKCLAPILRQRETLPKYFTLLLNGLKDVQEKSKPLEEEMRQSMFNLPFAIPLRNVATHITKSLLVPRSGANAEEEFHRVVGPQLKELDKIYADLRQEKNPKLIQKALELELHKREELQMDCLQLISDAVDAEKQLEGTLGPSHQRLLDQQERDMTHINKVIGKINESSGGVVKKIEGLTETAESLFKGETERFQTSMSGLRFKLSQCEARQEKIRRTVREELKEFDKEQKMHHRLIEEIVQRTVAWNRLSTAQQQFSEACAKRTELLKQAVERCTHLTGLTEELRTLSKTAVDHCYQHGRRIINEESFRKMRVSKSAIDNVISWHRCLNDLVFLKNRRLQVVNDRMADSWQLQYLLNHEKVKLEADLSELQLRREKLESSWKAVAVYLAEFKIPIPSLTRLDKNTETVERRTYFLSVMEANYPSPTKVTPKRPGGGAGGGGGEEDSTGTSISNPAAASAETESSVTLPPIPPPRQQPAAVMTPRPPPRAQID